MKKLVNVLATVFLILFLSPIVFSLVYPLIHEDTTQIAKDEFSKYYNGNNETALVIDFDQIYFEKNKVELNRAIDMSIMFYGESIYYSCAENESIKFYSCDFTGNNIKLEYSKRINSTKRIRCRVMENICYMEYKTNGLIHIDSYNYLSKDYQNIAKGENLSILDYIFEESSNYECNVIKDKSSKCEYFTIKDKTTKEEKIVDEAFLSKTSYIESMEKFKYSPKRVDISRGHILLTYSIGAGDGRNNPHLIFEYSFEEETLEYKCLVFPYDNVPIDIVYIEK